MKNLHSWQKFYTTAGRSGRDKFQLWSRDMNLKSAVYRIIMSRNRIFHRMTTTFSVGAVLFWSNSDLTLGECQHNDGHTPTACITRHNYDLISVSIPNVHLDQCCLTSAVVYVISGFSGPRIQIIDTMYPCAIGPIGQMVMVHQPLLLNQTVHKFVKVTLFHVTWLLIFGTFSWAEEQCVTCISFFRSNGATQFFQTF